jgi:hypothetical protein
MTSVGNYKGSDRKYHLFTTSPHLSQAYLPLAAPTLLTMPSDYQGAGRHEPGPALASHVKDPRLVLLDGLVPGLFADGSAVLDIGCNAGAVTVQIGKSARVALQICKRLRFWFSDIAPQPTSTIPTP